MSIPLDRLYHFIESTTGSLPGSPLVIYRYMPHGSKNLAELDMLKSYAGLDLMCWPHLYCHDQEPLDYQGNQVTVPLDQVKSDRVRHFWSLLEKYQVSRPQNIRQHPNIWDKCLLLHSELRSQEVEKYQKDQYIPVYYWSHAVIARDWFRYAQHVNIQKSIKKNFLIYNRAWTGTREYRLKFADLLVDNNLHTQCLASISPVDLDLNIHYQDYSFKNNLYSPKNILENFFTSKSVQSHYSADFDIEDYASTNIEVVLETLFDDGRWHLTEKVLRPIACGQPFLLVSTGGSLQYLKKYGFKSFDSIWSEHYDSVIEPLQRLEAVVQTMKTIVSWDPETRAKKLAQAQEIALYNQQLFFSSKFFETIVNELKSNLSNALHELEHTNTSRRWFDRRKQLAQVPEIKQCLVQPFFEESNAIANRKEILQVVSRAKHLSKQNAPAPK
jgi:hypothetical protein